MNKIWSATITVTFLMAAIGAATFSAPDASATAISPRSDNAMAFGMDAKSIRQQTAAGIKPDFGTVWVGPWVLRDGWSHVHGQMDAMRTSGVTPAIHFYYWGNDISKSCLENGCWSSVHGTYKDKAGWQRLANQLVDQLNARMAGKPVVVFLETEFNKNDVVWYEALDGYLADKARYIEKHYPAAHVSLALGNWNSWAWHVWDRAAGASDSIGIQGMRGSTRDSWTNYHGLYEATLSGAKKAKSLFGKPIIIHDVALSTYPEPNYVEPQKKVLQNFFTGIPQLKAVGVKAILYRAWADDPRGNLAEYYGRGERHWGVTYSWGSYKPAAQAWIDGVKAERGAAGAAAPSTSGDFMAVFAPASNINEWWADVTVKASNVRGVALQVDGGPWIPMWKTGWGTWAKSMWIPRGSDVVFRATSTSGQTATSGTYQWLTDMSPSTTSSFSASFVPSSAVNEWWMDVAVKSEATVSAVHMKVDGGSWIAMWKTGWGTWAKSMYIPPGSDVVFRATSSGGATALSTTYEGATGPTFSASFHPSSAVNAWWVDVKVKSPEPIVKVEVRDDGGSWIPLWKTSWGTWAKSTHIDHGSHVVFRATSGSGDTATSGTFRW